jgi:hypothetical protein
VGGRSAGGRQVYKAATMHAMPYSLQLDGWTARMRNGACNGTGGLTVNQPALAARAVLDEAPAIVLNGSCSTLWRRLSVRRGVWRTRCSSRSELGSHARVHGHGSRAVGFCGG